MGRQIYSSGHSVTDVSTGCRQSLLIILGICISNTILRQVSDRDTIETSSLSSKLLICTSLSFVSRRVDDAAVFSSTFFFLACSCVMRGCACRVRTFRKTKSALDHILKRQSYTCSCALFQMCNCTGSSTSFINKQTKIVYRSTVSFSL